MGKNKGNDLKRKKRVAPVFIGVLVFIVLVLVAIYTEINQYKTRVINMYNNNQSQIVTNIGNVVAEKQSQGADYAEIVSVFNKMVPASGSRFIVYERNDEILFAKTTMATDKLKTLKGSSEYWKVINETKVEIVSYSWDYQGAVYSVYIVTDTASIFNNYGFNQHGYYILFIAVVMCLVLFILIIVYVSMLDSTTASLHDTRTEMESRNKNYESYIESGSLAARNQVIINESEFEKSYSRLNKFYDVSILRNLLSKSNEEDLKPIKIVLISFGMSERYYSAEEILNFASCITDKIRSKEAFFEIRKGLFALIVFKTNDAEVNMRANSIKSELERENSKEKIFTGFTTNIYSLGAGSDAPIEEFEKILAGL